MDTKTALTFDEFAFAYATAFRKSNRYTPNEIGFGHYVEQMAQLADDYPEYLEQFEALDDDTINRRW